MDSIENIKDIQSDDSYDLEEDIEEDIADSGMDSFDFSKSQSVKSSSISRGNSEPGSMTIVNSEKSGKRITISKETYERLEKPDKVQVRFIGNYIAICEEFSTEDSDFIVKWYKNKGILYAGNLVEEITGKYNLDYSNRTSITFPKVDFKNHEGKPVALIQISSK